jgi:hypothetical protein
MQVTGVYFGLTSTFYCNDLPGALSQPEVLQPQGLTLANEPTLPGPHSSCTPYHCFPSPAILLILDSSLKGRLKLVSTLNARACTKPPAFPPVGE